MADECDDLGVPQTSRFCSSGNVVRDDLSFPPRKQGASPAALAPAPPARDLRLTTRDFCVTIYRIPRTRAGRQPCVAGETDGPDRLLLGTRCLREGTASAVPEACSWLRLREAFELRKNQRVFKRAICSSRTAAAAFLWCTFCDFLWCSHL